MQRSTPQTAARPLRHVAKAAIIQVMVAVAVLGTMFVAGTPAAFALGPAPSGQRVPQGDLPGDRYAPRGWHQVFADTFASTPKRANAAGLLPASDKWWGYWAGTRIVNSTNGVYDSSRVVSVSNGMMHFRLHSSKGVAYAAVESPKLPKQTYGRYSVRYRYAAGSNIAGFKSVWMLWPDSNQWGDGEIDFHELGNQRDRTSGWAAMHQACGRNNGCPQQVKDFALNPTRWHTATVMWTPGRVRVFLDGKLMTTSTSRVPTKPMHLLLQTEASDYGPQAAPNAVMKIDIDWVTVYTMK